MNQSKRLSNQTVFQANKPQLLPSISKNNYGLNKCDYLNLLDPQNSSKFNLKNDIKNQDECTQSLSKQIKYQSVQNNKLPKTRKTLALSQIVKRNKNDPFVKQLFDIYCGNQKKKYRKPHNHGQVSSQIKVWGSSPYKQQRKPIVIENKWKRTFLKIIQSKKNVKDSQKPISATTRLEIIDLKEQQNNIIKRKINENNMQQHKQHIEIINKKQKDNKKDKSQVMLPQLKRQPKNKINLQANTVNNPEVNVSKKRSDVSQIEQGVKIKIKQKQLQYNSFADQSLDSSTKHKKQQRLFKNNQKLEASNKKQIILISSLSVSLPAVQRRLTSFQSETRISTSNKNKQNSDKKYLQNKIKECKQNQQENQNGLGRSFRKRQYAQQKEQKSYQKQLKQHLQQHQQQQHQQKQQQQYQYDPITTTITLSAGEYCKSNYQNQDQQYSHQQYQHQYHQQHQNQQYGDQDQQDQQDQQDEDQSKEQQQQSYKYKYRYNYKYKQNFQQHQKQEVQSYQRQQSSDNSQNQEDLNQDQKGQYQEIQEQQNNESNCSQLQQCEEVSHQSWIFKCQKEQQDESQYQQQQCSQAQSQEQNSQQNQSSGQQYYDDNVYGNDPFSEYSKSQLQHYSNATENSHTYYPCSQDSYLHARQNYPGSYNSQNICRVEQLCPSSVYHPFSPMPVPNQFINQIPYFSNAPQAAINLSNQNVIYHMHSPEQFAPQASHQYFINPFQQISASFNQMSLANENFNQTNILLVQKQKQKDKSSLSKFNKNHQTLILPSLNSKFYLPSRIIKKQNQLGQQIMTNERQISNLDQCKNTPNFLQANKQQQDKEFLQKLNRPKYIFRRNSSKNTQFNQNYSAFRNFYENTPMILHYNRPFSTLLSSKTRQTSQGSETKILKPYTFFIKQPHAKLKQCKKKLLSQLKQTKQEFHFHKIVKQIQSLFQNEQNNQKVNLISLNQEQLKDINLSRNSQNFEQLIRKDTFLIVTAGDIISILHEYISKSSAQQLGKQFYLCIRQKKKTNRQQIQQFYCILKKKSIQDQDMYAIKKYIENGKPYKIQQLLIAKLGFTKGNQLYEEFNGQFPFYESQPLDEAKYIKTLENQLQVYLYPSQQVKRQLFSKLFDQNSMKTLIVFGQTGCGKSTFLNSLCNYLAGVELQDPFRYFLIFQDTQTQLKSITNKVNVYYVKDMRSNCNSNFTYRVIDTPGFGDTDGLGKDQQTIKKIQELLLKNNGLFQSIDQIHLVLIVIKSSLTRITQFHQYVWNIIMRLFHKAMVQNFTFVLTFSDASNSIALQGIKDKTIGFGQCWDKIKEPKCIQLNNSGFFKRYQPNLHDLNNTIKNQKKSNSLKNQQKISSQYFKLGTDSFSQLIQKASSIKPQSLQSTRLYIKTKREYNNKILEATVSFTSYTKQIQEISDNISNMIKISEHKQKLKKTQSQNQHNKQYEINQQEWYDENVEQNVNVTMCMNCTNISNCHLGCSKGDGFQKKLCSVMDSKGYCTVCPKNCHYVAHINCHYVRKSRVITRKINNNELEQKIKEQDQKRKVLQIQFKTFISTLVIIYEQLKPQIQCIQVYQRQIRCQQCFPSAYESSSIITRNYIEFLIQNQYKERKEEFQDIVSGYNQMLERVKTEEAILKQDLIKQIEGKIKQVIQEWRIIKILTE